MARLLLIDDDIAEISAVKRVLARAGLTPVLATNASDAQAALAQRLPDLLLVGATCEGGEALALTQRLEEDPATRGLPLIVLGAATGAPVHAVTLPRPVDPALLAEQVQALLTAGHHVEVELGLDEEEGPKATATVTPTATPTPTETGTLAPTPTSTRTPNANANATGTQNTTPSAAPTPTSAVSDPPLPSGERAGVRGTAAASPTRPLFERRGTPIELPRPLERRASPSDPARARLAAAEALRARAEELRRQTESPPAPSAPAAAEAAAGLDALFELAPPIGVELEPPPDEPPPLSAAMFEAPRAGEPWTERSAPLAEEELPPDPASPTEEPARAAEAEAPVPGPTPTLAPVVAPLPSPRLVDELEDRARAEEALAAEAEARAARLAEHRAQVEAEARAEAARLAEEAAARARQAEELARTEAAARAEAARRAEEEAERARLAEAAAHQEAEARRLLEEELGRLRAQLDADRAVHRTELESARAGGELEALRVRAELEAARRAEAEAALARLSADAAALATAREPPAESARPVPTARPAASRAAPPPPPPHAPQALPAAAPEPAPPAPVPLDGDPEPDWAQEAARRRALALRHRPEVADPRIPPRAVSAPGRKPAPPPPARPPPPPSAEAEGPAAEAPEPPPQAPPAELLGGPLDDLTAPRLLALAARARLEGRIDVLGGATRRLWFEGGRVVGATSDAPDERMDAVALRLGLLTREQHRLVATPASAAPGRRAALLLVERGFLKPAELTALVRRRTEEVVFGVFAEVGARFEWLAERVPTEERVSPDRPPLALAVEGVRRRWQAGRADEVLGGPASLLSPSAAAPSAAELGFAPRERRLLELADGLRTVDELLAGSPLDPLTTRQLLAAAVLTGALAVRVVQAGRPAALVSEAIDLARVREKLEQVRRADYFTILGVGRACTPHEVREAAARLLAELTPERWAAAREPGLPARLEEIRRVVAEAREVLEDDPLREEYLRGLGG